MPCFRYYEDPDNKQPSLKRAIINITDFEIQKSLEKIQKMHIAILTTIF